MICTAPEQGIQTKRLNGVKVYYLGIIESGKTGFVFEPNDMDSLITQIKYFIDEPHLVEKMRPAVLEKAKDFLPERIINQYITVYQQILAPA